MEIRDNILPVLGPKGGEEEVEDDRSVTVSFAFENMDYIANWLLRYGTLAEVIEPPALRDAVQERASSMAAQYMK